MKSWIKGGLWGLGIVIICLILFVIFAPAYCIGLSEDGTGCHVPQGIDRIIFNANGLLGYTDKIVLYFILPVIIIGSVISLIISKVRGNKKQNRINLMKLRGALR